MVNPIDYMSYMPKPNLAQNFMQGLQVGEGIQSIRDKRAAQEQMQAKHEAYKLDLQEALNNPTQRNWANMAAKYPDQYKAFESVRNSYGEEKIKNEFNTGIRVSTLLENGRADLAQDEIMTAIKAKENSGTDPAEFKTYTQALNALQSGNIDGAKRLVNMSLAVLDPERYTGAIGGQIDAETKGAQIQQAALEPIATSANIQDTQSQIQQRGISSQQEQQKIALQERRLNADIQDMAAKRNLDADQMSLDTNFKIQELNNQRAQSEYNRTKLTTEAQNLINEKAMAATASEMSATQFRSLAQEMEETGGGYGVGTGISAWFNKVTGGQGDKDLLKISYNRIRNSLAIKNLPPGPATDKDIQMVLEGFPLDTADRKTLAQFLRGMAKLEDVKASYESAQSEWINSTGYLGRSENDMEINGVKVPEGTSFIKFYRTYGDELYERLKKPDTPDTPTTAFDEYE